MKKAISIICVAVMLVMMVSLAACSTPGPDVTGTYKLVEMSSGGEDMTSMLTLITVTMTVEGDTALLELYGESLEWKVNTNNGTFSNADGATIPYRVEGDQLILEGGEDSTYGKMVFEKQDQD